MQNSIGCKLITFITLFLTTGISVWAQPNTRSGNENSPYSYYGIGLLSGIPNAAIRGMGGGGTGYNDGFSVNPSNPASYSFIRTATLDAGFEVKSRTSTFDGSPGVNSLTGNISHFGLAVPLNKFGGFAFGINPISNAYYSLADTINLLSERSVRHYGGSGSLQYAFAGIAGKVKGISIGVNVGYAFGNMITARSINSTDNASIRDLESHFKTSYGDILWKAGIMYHGKLPKDHFLNIGVTYTASQALKGKRTGAAVMRTYQYNSNGVATLINMDTISSANESRGELVMPSIMGFGIHTGKTDVYEFNADLQLFDWSKYSDFNIKDSLRDNTYRASLGFAYTPNRNAAFTKGSFFSGITYRIGAFMGNDYVRLRNTDISDLGGTFGFSFPLKRQTGTNQFGKLHTSFTLGRRGTFENGLAREFYVNFTIGASLSDIWFIKPKYD